MECSLNKIYEYIDSLNVMVISTIDYDTKYSRATPVFFARRDNLFYFVSFEETHHSRNIAENNYICASITQNYQNYREIRGAQIFGLCRKLSSLYESARAASVYFSKFLDFKAFLDPQLMKSAINVSWYEFYGERVIYTDNTIEFGYREKLELF